MPHPCWPRLCASRAGRGGLSSSAPKLPFLITVPPLSKDYLAGEKTLDEILIRPAKVYEKSEVEFILDTSVESINRDNKTIQLSNNETLPYDKLALTVGSKVRKVNLPGVELDRCVLPARPERCRADKRLTSIQGRTPSS